MYDLAETYKGWIEELLKRGGDSRNEKWTESVAVGSEPFMTVIKEKLGFKARGREVDGEDGSYKEPPASYKSILGHENGVQGHQNEYFW